MNTSNLIYLIENAEQGSGNQAIENGKLARTELNALLARIAALEAENAAERVNAETNGMKALELGKQVAELETALRQIANGDGYYGAQAKKYKDIARAALGE